MPSPASSAQLNRPTNHLNRVFKSVSASTGALPPPLHTIAVWGDSHTHAMRGAR